MSGNKFILSGRINSAGSLEDLYFNRVNKLAYCTIAIHIVHINFLSDIKFRLNCHFKYSLHLNPLRGSVNNHHTWEWCSLLSIVELQPTTNKSYFCFVIDVIVKPSRICPCRDKHHYRCMSAFLIALFDPFRQLPAVWRIAEY